MTFGSTFGRVLSPTFQPSSQAAAAAGSWWDLNGTLTSCVAAYQPKGAADYAASKVNLANPGTYDLSDGVAPNWDTGTGWGFTGTQYLEDTNYSPFIANFTLVFYGTYSTSATVAVVAGSRDTGNRGWAVKSEQYNNTGKFGFTLLGRIDYTSNLNTADGFYAVKVASNKTDLTYYDSSTSQSATIANTGYTPDLNGFVIGAFYRRGDYCDFFIGSLKSCALYNTELTDANVSALRTAMSAL